MNKGDGEVEAVDRREPSSHAVHRHGLLHGWWAYVAASAQVHSSDAKRDEKDELAT